VLWAFVFWTVLGLFFASQDYVLGDDRVSFTLVLRWAMPRWYLWGLLAPPIAAVDRWIGRGHSIGLRLALHLPLGLAWTALALTIRLCIRPLLGLDWRPSIAISLLEPVTWDLLINAVIAGVAIARDYAGQARAHEQEAHRLQLEAVELQRHLAEARLQSLRSQLQPHFLFNALNTMSSLTQTDPKTARRLMEQLGQLLRMSLRHAATPLVTLAEELAFLDDYLAIESVRFEGRLAFPCARTMTRSTAWYRPSCYSRWSRTRSVTVSARVSRADALRSQRCARGRGCCCASATTDWACRRTGARDETPASVCGTRRRGWSISTRAIISFASRRMPPAASKCGSICRGGSGARTRPRVDDDDHGARARRR
jgi:hypothetical protein